ncbi:hypothetical protein A5784_31680 [Mycobacterium sp. 852013-50091_SCH5140682]|uniref:gamma-glutamylcyclotransferase family protein n=1 Tax=Mycobacterium sp. 852013-50091_SCH5140682 TaxID=1834109 RepID=UPI0007EC0219|nr:gamma-glutamylcyclotransferase [Mycobacterium sp. 852013-50091_SCH5140682]OBC13429.1 hypothetical protein A5784_31680 [Mycobacterium sp. 852013-50091_SCH5140682]
MSAADLGPEHRLATYGTLSPGRSNAHVLEELAGTWVQGSIRGHFHERGWHIYPGIVLDDSGPEVAVHVFVSRDLSAHWRRLDEFEGPGYRRVPVSVSSDTGEVAAYVYALVDDPARGSEAQSH